MSDNKQSSVDWLALQLTAKMQMWNSTKNYQEFHIVLEAGDFAKLIEQAKAMHKEETLKLYYAYEDYVLREEGIIKTFGQFYNETFGCNNEQL